MKSITTLWNFSRPHTVIGSVISICALYAVVCDQHKTEHLSLLIPALAIGITCNIFIVGVNQIADVKIDKINKPYLPIPSGELNMRNAKIIVYSSLIISLVLALMLNTYLFVIIALSAAIGWAYSMPPFYLKRHHLPAALAISTVRGILVNLGGFMVFNYIVNGSLIIPENLKILTVFIVVFSIVISWFKDLPDVVGDSKYKIKTFAILYSPKVALIAGNILVGGAYLFTICKKSASYFISEKPVFQHNVLFFGHIILFLLFIINAFSIEPGDHQSTKKFYKRFWLFFFAEYMLYFVAYF